MIRWSICINITHHQNYGGKPIQTLNAIMPKIVENAIMPKIVLHKAKVIHIRFCHRFSWHRSSTLIAISSTVVSLCHTVYESGVDSESMISNWSHRVCEMKRY